QNTGGARRCHSLHAEQHPRMSNGLTRIKFLVKACDAQILRLLVGSSHFQHSCTAAPQKTGPSQCERVDGTLVGASQNRELVERTPVTQVGGSELALNLQFNESLLRKRHTFSGPSFVNMRPDQAALKNRQRHKSVVRSAKTMIESVGRVDSLPSS